MAYHLDYTSPELNDPHDDGSGVVNQPAGIVDHDDADYGAGHHNEHHDDLHDTVHVDDGRVAVHVNAAPGIIDHIDTVVLHDQYGSSIEYVKRSAVVELDRAWHDFHDAGVAYAHTLSDSTYRRFSTSAERLDAAGAALDL